jgi:uncharacterized protein YigE (DUF2233 family)
VLGQIPDFTTKNIEKNSENDGQKSYLKWAFLGLLMVAIGWMIADIIWGNPKPKIATAVPKKGGCTMAFKDATFDIFCTPIFQNGLKLFCTDDQKVPFRDVNTLRAYLQNQQKTLVFAMNAGMYTLENLPKGLYIENQQTMFPLDTAEKGFGNFYLQPNGVFAFDDSSAVILDTKSFQNAVQKHYNFATQSGPLLVINNQINPVFTASSNSLFIRNGVGISADGTLIFAISNQPINFHLFAAFFKEKLHCPNALFLDGAISKMYLPEINRLELNGNLGPFIALINEQKK